LKSIEVSQARTVARLLIEQLRSRNFILCFLGADSYGFVHRTFLEYFCACEFVERFGKRGLEGGLTLEELKTEVFGKHWQDESWHEVLRLIAGMIDTSFAGEIIDYLMALDGEAQKFINLFLAAKCLSEVRNRAAIAATDSRLFDYLKTLTQYSNDQRASTDEEFFLIREICSKAVAAIAITWKGNPETQCWLETVARSTRYWAVCQAVIDELVKEWANDSDLLSTLKRRARFDNDWYMRIGAVQELTKKWIEDPDTLLIFKGCAQGDRNLNVRRTAVHALASIGKGDPDTLSILKVCARSDNAWQVRRAALLELGREWKDEPGIYEFLCDRAINDPFKGQPYWFNPRLVALEAIIEQYPDHLQTLSLLRDRAGNDPDEKVREFAVRELARGWEDEPWMFEFLCDRVLNDPFERKDDEEDNPRQTALEIIIKQYRDRPQTLPLLQDRAKNDSDEKVREFANKKLAELEV
jgi:hypothetical protein